MPHLGSYNTHFAKYPGPLLDLLYIMSEILGFLGCSEVGARLCEVSIPSTLHYIVVLILVGKSYKKVLTLIYLFAVLRAVKKALKRRPAASCSVG